MRKPKTTLATQAASLCRIDRGHAVTDTPTIAKRFGMGHNHLMRDTKALFASVDLSNSGQVKAIGDAPGDTNDLSENGQIKKPRKGRKEQMSEALREKTRADKRAFVHQNFFPSTYKDNGREYPCYLVTEAGFRILTRRYKGDLADALFLDFERAFDYWRNRAVAEKAQQINLEWQETRALGKCVRRDLTDAIDRYVRYCIEHGSKNAKRYFSTITEVIERALFAPDDGEYRNIRQRLTPIQLMRLASVEDATAKALDEAISQGLPYKGDGGCYERAKERIVLLASAFGRTPVPALMPMLDFGAPKSLSQGYAA